ncbi:protein phosphatase slingshot protein [Dioscorea alata]|uniref:Protein phosphatase slingshot protein n=4 Tax=Dioscorea alata TaxID=55571 RepID=A0ACB7VX70_DIOAL|nr:protein phosphatase slingshot protein [Dioscorea alata]KAH7679245.1 protein phosphatase slingshot protein [Dioscorea alata]KAH7679246.1 protein phosphatase slingshot protein [Dioscorea alata]KAH7679247.1 protein phosphatase slingshot protein [Dioscorea alata]
MASMDDDAYLRRMAALLQAISLARVAKQDSVICQIEDGLYLGSVGAAQDKEALKKLNITHILTVAKSLLPAYPNEFVYKRIDVLDSSTTNLAQYFDECFEFINEARRSGGGVLVHCFAGISRSATVVVAYLMKEHRMPLSQALELVRSKRPQICPNFGFRKQLEDFEKSLEVTQNPKAIESMN